MNVDTSTLLEQAANGNGQVLVNLRPQVYSELRRIAHRYVAAEQHATINTTALVHEVYIRIVGNQSVSLKGRAYFFATAARSMRQILVDSARRKKSLKRGAGFKIIGLTSFHSVAVEPEQELRDLHTALERLSGINDRYADIVECRFFGGMSVDETAHALGVSPRTVYKEWAIARALLRSMLDDNS